MKKLNIKNIILLSFLLITTISCDDNLDRFPSNSIEQTQSFKTIADAENWDNGLFSTFRARVYGVNTYVTDVQADQLNATLDYGNRNGFPHRWEGFLSTDQTIASVWQGYYSSLRNVNVALEGYPTIETTSPEEETYLNQMIGKAYLLRAFYYHRLVLRFAKAYNPSTASSDLGVPLVLNYDVNYRPSRSTIEEVYNQILSDINEAKSRLSSVSGEAGATKFTSDAVLALEARVKLYMQDWSGAKTAADLLINSGNYPLLTSQSELDDMWVNDYSQEIIMQSFVSAPNELPGTNSIYLGFSAGTGMFTPDFVPSQWVLDKFDDADFRKNTFFDSKEILIQGSTYSDIMLVNKYPGNPTLFTGATTNYAHAPKVFRIAEMYLISAEAAAMSSGDALTPLNTLRVARNLPPLTGITGTTLLNEIKDERFRELAFEGFRLDDLKRWDEGFTRTDPQSLDFINIGPNYNTLSKDAGDYQFVWGIPSNDIISNENLASQQNPGW
ncbi:RagB/SusD family nutrient uptake outer membrane protein [Polaribacter sargassicola]|uniref:RagB/SusD family nutrient uptake outer membrane protein n=1 Tax=Polaribacter sargassicola TaxID=2836891 RepID=UPI001F46F321|nr:RagB/SusD family nutrient uptake outer membrane protein [Polaribacter sp. DS7-9]MCG1036200.1 RagB/SusD family nutrient uptake outer membrane protein [Polaribacter sp. DS7-9]